MVTSWAFFGSGSRARAQIKATPEFDTLEEVLSVVPEILDPDKASVAEETDPYVLALALKHQREGKVVTVLNEERRDRPQKMSMTTACGILRLVARGPTLTLPARPNAMRAILFASPALFFMEDPQSSRRRAEGTRVKGASLIARLEYVVETGGDELRERVLERLSPEDRKTLENRPLASSLFPLDLNARLDEAIALAVNPTNKIAVFR